MKHASGPWIVVDNRDLNGAYWICAQHPQWGAASLAEVRDGGEEAAELGDVRANAALIAAAPEMLKALENILISIEKRDTGKADDAFIAIGNSKLGQLGPHQSKGAAMNSNDEIKDQKTLPKLMEESSALVQKVIEAKGELDPMLDEVLSGFNLSVPQNVDSLRFYMTQIDHQISYFRNQAMEFERAAQHLSRAEAKFKEYLKFTMIGQGITELEGIDYRYKLTNAKPSLILEEEAIPKEYKTQVVEDVVDKKRVEEDLKLGVPVQGARLEPSYTLRSYVNKRGV